MTRIKNALFKAFHEDHAILGKGFHVLAMRIREGSIAPINKAADELDQNAGAHIAFEEFDFYPLLKQTSPSTDTAQMYKSHNTALSVLTDISRLEPIDGKIPPSEQKKLLEKIYQMEGHIAECGELFSIMSNLGHAQIEKLNTSLKKWRDLKPRWTEVSAINKNTGTDKSTYTSNSNQLPFLLSDNLAPDLTRDDKSHIQNTAEAITKNEPTISLTSHFGPNVHQGYKSGPVLYYEDHRSIALAPQTSTSHYQYRFLPIAREQDIVILENERSVDFEDYCQNILKLAVPKTICLPSTDTHLPLAKRIIENKSAMKKVTEIAKENRTLNIMPYISTGWTWVLANYISRQADVPVYVMAPPPKLCQKLNNKLWFSEMLVRCLGQKSLPQTYYAFGPTSLAAKILRLAKTNPAIVLKVPSSAGSMGNKLLDATPLKNMTLKDIKNYVLELYLFENTPLPYPLAVSVWDQPVETSPSVQMWIHKNSPPVIEGVFEQILDKKNAAFIGARPAQLRQALEQKILHESSMIAHLLQQLGYYGRCSMDAVVTGNDKNCEIHWIDCNARWGGVSTPMTIANNLTGNWKKYLRFIVQHSSKDLRIPRESFIDATANFQYGTDKNHEGIVITNPPVHNYVARHDYLILSNDASKGRSIYEKVRTISEQLK